MKNFRILALGLLAALYGSSHAITAGTLSLAFEENRGQGPVESHFLARGHGYNIVLSPGGNRILLRHAGRGVALHTRIVDSNSDAVIRGEEKLAGRVNYIRRDASLTNIPTYARVRYERVYPGIDLIYYGNQQQLEYDFVVHPGADPGRIALQFDGADAVTIDAQGNLVLRAAESEIVQHRPVVYQRVGSSRKEIEGEYRLLSANTVAFDIGPYDPTAPLVIDPILSYSTFLGGTNGDDDARAVATDSAGNLLVTGTTTSTDFQTSSPLQSTAGSSDPTSMISDAFVTKLNPAGTALIYSTYLGGSGDDDVHAIAVDGSGYAVITGSTKSTDFPTTPTAVRRVCNDGPNGCFDAFVSAIDATGSMLLYSTYLGGTGDDEARGLDLDTIGNAYVTGRTDSADFPTTFGAYSLDPAAGGFVTKITIGGTIQYSTYFGTIFGPADPSGIAVDATGNTYITGGIVIPGSNTGVDIFLTKLNPSGSAILYTQTIRGAKDDISRAIAIDSAGNAYVAGETTSSNFPTVSAFQSAFGGGPAFRSVNGGTTWAPSSSGMNRTSLHALAVAPGTPSAIYVGADDETGGGLFKSTNGGDTWTSSTSGLQDVRIHALAVDPLTPATVYAGTRTLGVYKSTNGGSTWSITPLNNVFVTALAIDQATPSTIYAGTENNGIYKSFNGGTTWFSSNGGLPTSPIRSIVIEPSANNTVYAATSAGVYKSANGGSVWAPSSSGLLDSSVNVLAADPRTPNLLLAGTNSVGVFRSSNGGGLWVAANGGLTSSSSVISVSALAIDPVTGTWYAAAGESNAMQVYKSTNGTNWTPTGLASTRVSAIAVDRNNAGAVLAATVGGSDAFIAKWNASGALVYATYLGGYRDDAANAVGVDSSGGVYVAGRTSSTNFPLLNPLQSAFGGGSGIVSDAFAAKLEASGAQLGFSTYLGGSSDDFAHGIAVDSSNTAYVVGVTASSDFPSTATLNSNRPGLLDAFIVKIGEGSALAYAAPVRGGFSATSLGTGASTSVGYARIQQTSGGNLPSGLAIFGFRQNNVLVSETAVPASTLISSGRIYAEVSANVNTGIAIANPNPAAVSVTFYYTDLNGQRSGENTILVGANEQIARFLDQSPFFAATPLSGSFTFTSSQPVAVIALRGFTNERGEFLLTTLPVADLSLLPDTEAILFPHFADGGGWTTQILLVNTTDAAMSGTVQFAGSATQNYGIPPRSAAKIASLGTSTGVVIGSVRVTPGSGSSTPSGVGVFSFKNAGVTVTETGVPALRAGNAFRLYAESSGAGDQVGSIQTGIAIANPSSSTTTVTFELTTITGVSTGLVSSIQLPGNGQVAMFLGQIPGFAGVPNPFQGVLRVTTTSPAGITLVGLRGRYNERRDFLLTTTQPTNETTFVTAPEQFFPHFTDGGGYTTQFILFNGAGNQSSSGVIRFVSQSGQSLSVGVR